MTVPKMTLPNLNRALMLQRQDRSPDGAGGATLTWLTLGTIWAEITAARPAETQGEERMLSRISWRITLRAFAQGDALRPTAQHRFRDGARIFTVLAVAERDPSGRYLTCFCREEGAS